MPFIKLENFSGISPRTGPTLLEANQAQTANNLKIQSGELRPWRQPVLSYVTSNTTNTQTIYKLQNTNTGSYVWLEWTVDVDVVASPVADSTDYRIYYTNGTAPKKTNWNLATTSETGVKPFPDTEYNMGVPSPTAAPTLTKVGGSGTIHEDRVYVYTYISTFGAVLEESAPSPPTTIVSVEPNASVTVSAFSTAPTTSAGYNITAIRIYRSVSSGTTANYLYVGTVTVTPSTGAASGSFSDAVLAANLGIAIPSLYYTPPPAGLKGLVSMPNGILAGFQNNEVWFCEPYLPHAWPVSYMLTVNAPIVGLGVFGQTLVVCTSKSPFLITGSQPGAMTQERLSIPEPCVSKKSIVSDQFGVLYASPNGLVSLSPGTQDVISRALFTRDEWQTYIPTTFVSAIYQNMYIAFYTIGATVKALILTRGDNPPLITLDTGAQAVFVERTTANVYVVSPTDGYIYQLDADPVNNLFFEWKSKKFVLPEPTNFGIAKMQADWEYISSTTAYNAHVAEIVAANQALWALGGSLKSTLNRALLNGLLLNGSTLEPIPNIAETRNVQALLIADYVDIYSTGFTSQEPARLPSSKKGYVWEIKLTGNAPIRSFKMATSVGELKQI